MKKNIVVISLKVSSFLHILCGKPVNNYVDYVVNILKSDHVVHTVTFLLGMWKVNGFKKKKVSG